MRRFGRWLTSLGGLVLLAACNPAEPPPAEKPPPGGVGGTSGGLATLVIEGKTLSFVPRGTEVLAFELEGARPLATAGVRVQSAGLSFEASACAADPVALKVVCVGYASSKVAVIHVTPRPFGLRVEEFDLGLTDDAYAHFSGGECLNCGVLTDPGDDRFIVASGDGYRVLDYRGNLLASYLDPRYVTENFGYDHRENRILAPEYERPDPKFWIIDLDDGRAYRWTKAMTDLPDVPSNFLADAAAIDTETGLAVIGHEWSPGLLFVDLKNASWDPGGTFDADGAFLPLEGVFTNMDWLTTGLAVESTHHIAFFVEEFGNALGAVRLPAEPGLPDAPDYTSAAFGGLAAPDPCQFWTSVGDPHGLAVFTTPVGGKPRGLSVNADKTCLAVVDLDALLKAPQAPGTHRADPDYDLVSEGVVRYFELP